MADTSTKTSRFTAMTNAAALSMSRASTSANKYRNSITSLGNAFKSSIPTIGNSMKGALGLKSSYESAGSSLDGMSQRVKMLDEKVKQATIGSREYKTLTKQLKVEKDNLSVAEAVHARKIEGTLRQFVQSIPVIGTMTERLRGLSFTLKAVGAAGILAASGFYGISSAYASLKSQMLESEQQIIRLKTALQDTKMATQEYAKSVQFAASTPFAVGDTIEAVVGLRSFQVDPFKNIADSGRNTMEVLADMAGAMGTDVATAGWALQRAMVGEWEIMQNNFLISARMIPQLQGLATGTDAYKQAIIKFLSEQQRFIGGQELAAKSIKGMTSNIADAFSMIGIYAAGVADSEGLLRGVTAYDDVRKGIEGIYNVVTRATPLENYTAAMNRIALGGDKATKALELFKAKSIDLKGLKQMGFDDKILSGFEKFQNVIESGVNIDNVVLAQKEMQKNNQALAESYLFRGTGELPISQAIDRAVNRTQQFVMVGQVVGQVFRVVYAAVIEPFFNGVAWLADNALAKFWGLIDGFIDLRGTINSVSGEMGNMTDVMNMAVRSGIMTQQELDNGLRTITEEQQQRLKELSIGTQTFSMKVISAISIYASFVILIIRNAWEKFSTWFSGVFGPLIKGVMNFLGSIGEGFSTVWKSIEDSTGTSPLTDLMEAFKLLKEAVEDIVSPFSELFNTIGDETGFELGGVLYLGVRAITLAFMGLAGVIRFLAYVFKETFSYIVGAVNGIVEAVKQLREGKILSSVKTFMGAFNGEKQPATNFITGKTEVPAGTITEQVKKTQFAANVEVPKDTRMAANTSMQLSLLNSSKKTSEDMLSVHKEGYKAIEREDKRNTRDLIKAVNGVKDVMSSYKTGPKVPTPDQKRFGSFNVPKDGEYTLHGGEIVVPPADAEKIRRWAGGVPNDTSFVAGLSRLGRGATAPGEGIPLPQQATTSANKETIVNVNNVYNVAGSMDKEAPKTIMRNQIGSFKRAITGVVN